MTQVPPKIFKGFRFDLEDLKLLVRLAYNARTSQNEIIRRALRTYAAEHKKDASAK